MTSETPPSPVLHYANPTHDRPVRTSKLSVGSLWFALVAPPLACRAGMQLHKDGLLAVGVSTLAVATVMPAIAALRVVQSDARLRGVAYSVVAWLVVAIWWGLFALLGSAVGLFGGQGSVG